MKKIAKPVLKSATPLKAADMNRIHFGGIHSPLTVKDLLNNKSEVRNDAEQRSFH